MYVKAIKNRRDFLFKSLFGLMLDDMDYDEYEEIITGIDRLEFFYDITGTYFLIPCEDCFISYNIYRVIGNGRYGLGDHCMNYEKIGVLDISDIEEYFDEDRRYLIKNTKKEIESFRYKIDYLKNKHNFNGLYHFTDFSNLTDIFKVGYISSRNECSVNGVDFVDGARKSVLYNTNDVVKEKVRFYYRPKTPTLYDTEGIKLIKFMNRNPHLPIPVYLIFDEELIYLDTSEFSNGNAANSDINGGFEFFDSIDWNAVFHDSSIDHKERDYIVNKRQAELLSSIPIPLSYCKNIVFRSEADKKRAINLFGEDNRFSVDLSIFSDKNVNRYVNKPWHYNNFIKDYEIKYSKALFGKETLLIKLYFQKEYTAYEITTVIKNKNGNTIKDIILNNNIINSNFEFNALLEVENEDWCMMEVYLNGILCIEESLEKYR